MATETYWCPGAWPWEWFNTCTREVPDPADPCNAPACTGAKARLADARNRFNKNCVGLRALRGIEKILLRILETPLSKIAIAAIIATILSMAGGAGSFVAGVIWGLIVLYGVSWVLLFAVERTMGSIAVFLDKARTDMEAAFIDVLANCPASCRGDLTIPDCKLE